MLFPAPGYVGTEVCQVGTKVLQPVSMETAPKIMHLLQCFFFFFLDCFVWHVWTRHSLNKRNSSCFLTGRCFSETSQMTVLFATMSESSPPPNAQQIGSSDKQRNKNKPLHAMMRFTGVFLSHDHQLSWSPLLCWSIHRLVVALVSE